MIDGCKFCALSASPEALIVGSVYVLPDAYPVTPHHVLVIPLRHCSDYFEMTQVELTDTHRALQRLRACLVRDGVEGFNVGWNCGDAAGQTVCHAHCHLIPRRLGDMVDPTGGVRGVIPWRQKYAAMESAPSHSSSVTGSAVGL
ncbi:HIT family protein [Mycobacteroides abscessus subsp. massiliense]|nr:HIT family protein [Mycobacteroides chelonae]MBN7507527.1 HIT family protein [Mycobacteroides abscessus subsp. massiliense]PVA40494.1 HIT family protein [Mycobacteroides abscessus]SHU07168.1 type III restriction enzyme res subunit [Mycobacteroides abscessus subsp. abscessus]PVB01798.1 HIT family protein [Mycobacteroides abscessus]